MAALSTRRAARWISWSPDEPLTDLGANFGRSEELRSRIVKALLVTIRSPSLFCYDELSQSEVVLQLENDPTFSPLYKVSHAGVAPAVYLLLWLDSRTTVCQLFLWVCLHYVGERMALPFVLAPSIRPVIADYGVRHVRRVPRVRRRTGEPTVHVTARAA